MCGRVTRLVLGYDHVAKSELRQKFVKLAKIPRLLQKYSKTNSGKLFWQRVASLVKSVLYKKKDLLRAERPRYEYSASVSSGL